MTTLAGKVAMITGSGGEHGFGRAIARRLAAAGADLVLTDIAPTGTLVVKTKSTIGWEGLETIAQEIRQTGRRAISALVDVRSIDQVRSAVDRGLQELGAIDILVNNAAAPPGKDRVPVVELSEEAWDVVLDTNLKGSFQCAKIVAATMLRLGVRGRIINMSSDCGKVGQANLAAYCASKFGVIGFTQALAMELASAGITVNAICPGAADTDRLDYYGRKADGSFDAQLRADTIKKYGASIPLGRVATVEDVAGVAAFLASDAASYITGQAINVAGGVIMH
jgi:NAD(P)-dependent dehydrogenase (short-subunit alcohol dehydrogenase family)